MAESIVTVKKLVRVDIPSITVLSDEDLEQLAITYQNFLAPRFLIPDADKLDDTKYTYLQNNLVAKLIVRAKSLQSLSNAVTSSGGSGATVGATKSIKTGPSEASWYDPSLFWKSVLGTKYSSFEQFEQEICMFANDLGVRLPFCKAGKKTTIFTIAKKSSKCN